MAGFTCQDKDGTEIICTADNWKNHIVSEHPEMGGCEAHVKTIEKPYQVYQDARNINRKVVYKPFILPKPFHTQYLRVAIEYKKRRFGHIRGYVVTAFSCTGIRKGDILLWEETK
jgi:hypothetical protein